MKAVGYVRVSTDRQAELGTSVEAQEVKIRAIATLRGCDLGDVIVDGGESAKDLNRPGIKRVLTLIDGGDVDAVILAKLDRLTRSVRDLCALLESFEKRKVALISVAESLDTGSAPGRLVITIMGAVSQWERETISERTRDALRHKRAQGQRRKYRLRISARPGSQASRAGPGGADCVSGNPSASKGRFGSSENSRNDEPASVPHTGRHSLAAGASGASPEAKSADGVASPA